MADDPRAFDAILRPGDNSGTWRTENFLVYEPDSATEIVLSSEEIIGLRHRYHTRMIAIDLDNHGVNNWTKDDPRLLRLIAEAEGADCWPVLVPSPRGFHLWLIIPEALPIVSAHYRLRALLQLAEIDQKVELFPSLADGDDIGDAKERPRSNGIRLPGQFGTVIPGDPFSDPISIWRDLRQGLDITTTGEGWANLGRLAVAIERRVKQQARRLHTSLRLPPSHTAADRMLKEIVWASPGESNANLGSLANVGHIAGNRTIESLAHFIEEKALLTPGFHQHASADTKRRLSSWARDWAASCVKSPPRSTGTHRPPSKDAGRNARLRREAFCKLLDAAMEAARTHGRDALSWSQRQVEKVSGVARSTIRRLKFHWTLRVLAVLNRPKPEHPAASGRDPSHQGGGPPAVSSKKNSSPAAFPPREVCQLHEKRPPPPSATDQTLLPTVPKKFASPLSWLAAKCSRERTELLAWLQTP